VREPYDEYEGAVEYEATLDEAPRPAPVARTALSPGRRVGVVAAILTPSSVPQDLMIGGFLGGLAGFILGALTRKPLLGLGIGAAAGGAGNVVYGKYKTAQAPAAAPKSFSATLMPGSGLPLSYPTGSVVTFSTSGGSQLSITSSSENSVVLSQDGSSGQVTFAKLPDTLEASWYDANQTQQSTSYNVTSTSGAQSVSGLGAIRPGRLPLRARDPHALPFLSLTSFLGLPLTIARGKQLQIIVPPTANVVALSSARGLVSARSSTAWPGANVPVPNLTITAGNAAGTDSLSVSWMDASNQSSQTTVVPITVT
jgi:hypothetical protein